MVPKLRFKEFHSKWNFIKYHEITNLVTNGFVGKSKEFYVDSNGVTYIQGYNVTEGGFNLRGIKQVALDFHKKNKKSSLLEGDLLTIQTGDIGVTTIVPKELEGANCHALIISRFKLDLAFPYFYLSYFNSQRGRNELKTIETGSTMKHLNVGDVVDLVVPHPSQPEQKKIASFLTAIDERIKQLNRKKELLEQYKKGTMQQLFSGKLRFKNKNEEMYPKWSKKVLGEIGETFSGLTGKSKEDFGEGKPYIQYKQIFDNSKINITKCGFVQITKGEKQQKVRSGDIFFTTSSETPNEVGFASVLMEHVGEMYLNSFCFGYRPHSLDIIVPQFAQYLFRNELWRRIIIKLAQGSTRYNMSKTEFMKLSVSLPVKEEQEKIATFLSSIDEKIVNVSSQINQIQLFKNGLLQQMFV